MLPLINFVGGISSDLNFLHYTLFKFQILLCLESEKPAKFIFRIIAIEKLLINECLQSLIFPQIDVGPWLDDCESNVLKIKLISNKTRPENLIRRFQFMPMAQICIKRNFLYFFNNWFHFILHFFMLMVENTWFVKWSCLHLIQLGMVIIPCYSISSFSGWCKFGGHGL